MKHIKLKTINLKNHTQFNERWLQDIIADEPTILGIGDVILKDKERSHIRAGRLDLLLQDADGYGRYEVEIQLGSTDESHIIRTIEYWDIERKKYPQYEHTAVIIAEDITSRFLNVVSLFNGFIPLMAIQVTAIKTPEGIGLQFTKVLDTVKLGYQDEDEEISERTDRNYWEKRGTKKTVALADKILDISQSFLPFVEFSYNKSYIGFWVAGLACNFAVCRPQKGALKLEISLPKTDETEEVIINSELDFLDYDSRKGRYKLKLTEQDISQKEEIISQLLKQAYELRK
jgi:predicted transport protein